MSLGPFDKEFLQRLRRVAKERGVKLVLDKDRLDDHAYVDELRKHHPLNATEPQWRFASDISEATGRPVGLAEATNSFRCSRYIDENCNAFYEIAPSKEQRACAFEVARRHRVDVPRKALLNKEAFEEWIAVFRGSDVTEVADILHELGWGSGRIQREIEKQGFKCPDGNWYRSVEFINWMIETRGHLLRDPNARFDAKRKAAEEMLRRGHDCYSVADNLNLPDSVVAEIAKRVEADGYIVAY